MTALLVYACREVSTWSVVLFLFPAFAAQKFFLLYREQRATSEVVESLAETEGLLAHAASIRVRCGHA